MIPKRLDPINNKNKGAIIEENPFKKDEEVRLDWSYKTSNKKDFIELKEEGGSQKDWAIIIIGDRRVTQKIGGKVENDELVKGSNEEKMSTIIKI